MAPMDHDELRAHIEAATPREVSAACVLTARILRAWWPGGSDDCTQPAALAWVRRWRSGRMETALPACSCASIYPVEKFSVSIKVKKGQELAIDTASNTAEYCSDGTPGQLAAVRSRPLDRARIHAQQRRRWLPDARAGSRQALTAATSTG